MNKIYQKIMKRYDRHLDGEYLSWIDYDVLIRLILKESTKNESALKSEVAKLKQRIINLKEAMC